MVDLWNGLILKWWSEDRTEKILFMVQNVQNSNGPPSHMALPFEYRTLILSCIQVFDNQMVTVH